ncbi:uracil DNA glycosylase [Elasticomyces elasticus]|uniref:Uracil-DNA glycosylase n=1 Tax=Exophiala sideris TaxID=1016849 RepID=A0ABR0JAH2_9EURO|nr:uracil DNA glycosylase [Elasticomyces elasticus]KAK5030350.1 uracil DNA glycosylase [Exophiala sideris]KAK5038403.1 uracil DNA glycosylase [Exophiala sideris]KAK5060286.1 uracil DNA glycosylase [Exophiala sideris]KAK5183197.1 uracil DNA glycosylase [Eurotiomycetes sp. CCFEE 6388]
MSLKRKDPPTSVPDAKKPKKNADLTSFFGPPKVTPKSAGSGAVTSTTSTTNGAAAGTAADAPPIKFDKDKWVASLTDEQRSLLKLEIDTLDPSWLAQLKDEVTSREFLNLKRFLQKEIDAGQKIYPPLEDVYSWSRHCPLHQVRVVILGQDPYHGNNQAHGLCFSVRPPTPAPPSLKNIYTAIKRDYPSFTPPAKNSGLLTPWADQGVLLLNTCLTVRAGQANSHANHGWEKFTQKVIDTVVKTRTRGVVFLAWGSPAQKRCDKISGARHVVLKSVHPSPLSAHKGFFDCGHFKKANEWLESRYGAEGVIDWNLNVQKPIKAPDVLEPVKVTETQSKEPEEDGPVTELPEKKSDDGKDHRIVEQDEFAGEDDEDAMAALDEVVKLEAEQDKKDT